MGTERKDALMPARLARVKTRIKGRRYTLFEVLSLYHRFYMSLIFLPSLLIKDIDRRAVGSVFKRITYLIIRFHKTQKKEKETGKFFSLHSELFKRNCKQRSLIALRSLSSSGLISMLEKS